MFQANTFSVRGKIAKAVMHFAAVIQDRFQLYDFKSGIKRSSTARLPFQIENQFKVDH